MADNKKLTGKPDRTRVSTSEPYEMQHLAKKTGMPKGLVTNVTKQAGPTRTAVERKLGQMKSNARPK